MPPPPFQHPPNVVSTTPESINKPTEGHDQLESKTLTEFHIFPKQPTEFASRYGI